MDCRVREEGEIIEMVGEVIGWVVGVYIPRVGLLSAICHANVGKLGGEHAHKKSY